MTKEIVENVNSIAVESIDNGTKSAFCKIWPTVKEGLLLLAKAVPALTLIVNLVIVGGDALSKKICG
jgi:uncharacterized membrane protein